MAHGAPASEHNTNILSSSLHLVDLPASEHGKDTSSIPAVDIAFSEATVQRSNTPPSALRQNIFMIFITLTQLVQMIPLGAGINSGLAIGKALGATRVESVWIVASYPLTQGAFVLIGRYLPPRAFYPLERNVLEYQELHSKWSTSKEAQLLNLG